MFCSVAVVFGKMQPAIKKDRMVQNVHYPSHELTDGGKT
jgi:hypothetical protein